VSLDPGSLSPASLFQRFQNGDEESGLQLWRQVFLPAVLPVARSWAGHRALRRQYEAEDLVLEVWSAWVRQMPRFRWQGPEAARAWARDLARSVCRGLAVRALARRRGGGRVVDAPTGVREAARPAGRSSQPTPSRLLMAEERRRHIREAVSLLPEVERLILRGVSRGIALEELADRLGVSVRTVHRHKKGALEAIRRHLLRVGLLDSEHG